MPNRFPGVPWRAETKPFSVDFQPIALILVPPMVYKPLDYEVATSTFFSRELVPIALALLLGSKFEKIVPLGGHLAIGHIRCE